MEKRKSFFSYIQNAYWRSTQTVRETDRQTVIYACTVHCGVHKWWAHHPKFQNKHDEYAFESELKAMSLTFFLPTTTLW